MILTTNECMFIGNQYKTNSTLSLFNSLEIKLDGTEENTLKEKGILINGDIDKNSKKIFDIVSKAEKSSRLILSDQNLIVEKYTYTLGNESIIVENVSGEFAFNKLFDFSDVNDELSEFLGISLIKNTDLKITLTNNELIVLLTLVDMYRQDELMNYGKFNSSNINLTKSYLISQIDKPLGSSIAKILETQYDIHVSNNNDIDLAIKGLIDKKYINDALELNKDLDQFARTFLIPNLTVLLEQYHINENGELVIMSGFIISAGLRNKACFIFSDEGVELLSLSSIETIELINNFLK